MASDNPNSAPPENSIVRAALARLADGWSERYRLAVVNEESLEEVQSYRLTRLNIYLFVSSVLVGTVLFTMFLFFVTPLKYLIPGYADTNALSTRKELTTLYKRIDSLEAVTDAHRNYTVRLGKALRGEKDAAADLEVPAVIAQNAKQPAVVATTTATATPETPLVAEGGTVSSSNNTDSGVQTLPESLVFVVPVKGLVTDAFKAEPSHYGIDIAAPQNSPVVATLAGTVVVAEWTPTTGYVLGIQHRFGLVSFYRHNAQLFKKVGENVVAGEAVASVGSTGDLSSGPHLHFELWHGGTPLNPTVYMKF